MYAVTTNPVWLPLALAVFVLYFILAFIAWRRKTDPFLGRKVRTASLSAAVPDKERFIAPLIDKPADHPTAVMEQDPDPDEEETYLFEPVDDEESMLLKEAEKVVEKIQDVVDHIASLPANPDEVFTKIRAIVSQYTFFENTEYYEAINNFVQVTVQRDCDLALTVEDLTALWYKDAA